MKKILFVCEGYEEFDYITQLKKSNVWSNVYNIIVKNAKSIDNVAAMYQYNYNVDMYDLIVIFCDTELPPYNQFETLCKKIKNFFAKDLSDEFVYFVNPCTMQVILSHFGNINLISNSKNINSNIIQQLTGVKNYVATENQRIAIMKKIDANNYLVMKKNLNKLSTNYKNVPSTNFVKLLNNLESDNTVWIDKINRKI